MTDEELAVELIRTIRSKTSPRAVLLEDRIEKANEYLHGVDTPDAHTLNHVQRLLSGEYDELKFHNPAALLRDLFTQRWVCQVFTSGYHNGCKCDPKEPHGGWGCGYRWVADRLTDAEAREYGLTTETKETTT